VPGTYPGRVAVVIESVNNFGSFQATTIQSILPVCVPSGQGRIIKKLKMVRCLQLLL
jgi:hypothetical protein